MIVVIIKEPRKNLTCLTAAFAGGLGGFARRGLSGRFRLPGYGLIGSLPRFG
jgi:hypothetical protein